MTSLEAILSSSIAVIGAGSVGSTVAYTLINKPIASEILLVDPKEEIRDAHVRDLSDATFHGSTSTTIRAGTHKEAGQCDIIIVTAGAKQKKGASFITVPSKVGKRQAQSANIRRRISYGSHRPQPPHLAQRDQ
jgi:threonine dehydrogenase-like Zn-dependent dehydrogenase